MNQKAINHFFKGLEKMAINGQLDINQDGFGAEHSVFIFCPDTLELLDKTLYLGQKKKVLSIYLYGVFGTFVETFSENPISLLTEDRLAEVLKEHNAYLGFHWDYGLLCFDYDLVGVDLLTAQRLKAQKAD